MYVHVLTTHERKILMNQMNVLIALLNLGRECLIGILAQVGGGYRVVYRDRVGVSYSFTFTFKF